MVKPSLPCRDNKARGPSAASTAPTFADGRDIYLIAEGRMFDLAGPRQRPTRTDPWIRGLRCRRAAAKSSRVRSGAGVVATGSPPRPTVPAPA